MRKMLALSLVLVTVFLVIAPVMAGGQGNITAYPYDPDPSAPYNGWITWRNGNSNNFQVGWAVGIQILNMYGETNDWSIERDGVVVASGTVASGNFTNFKTAYIISADDLGSKFKVYVGDKSDAFQVKW